MSNSRSEQDIRLSPEETAFVEALEALGYGWSRKTHPEYPVFVALPEGVRAMAERRAGIEAAAGRAPFETLAARDLALVGRERVADALVPVDLIHQQVLWVVYAERQGYRDGGRSW